MKKRSKIFAYFSLEDFRGADSPVTSGTGGGGCSVPCGQQGPGRQSGAGQPRKGGVGGGRKHFRKKI